MRGDTASFTNTTFRVKVMTAMITTVLVISGAVTGKWPGGKVTPTTGVSDVQFDEGEGMHSHIVAWLVHRLKHDLTRPQGDSMLFA